MDRLKHLRGDILIAAAAGDRGNYAVVYALIPGGYVCLLALSGHAERRNRCRYWG
jgi:hypothetical protein